MKQLLTFCCVMAVAAFSVQAAETKITDISHEALKKAIEEKKVVLIDVNGTDSFKAGHIPGAIDFQAQKTNLAKLLPADKNALIVAYCGNEQCGAYQRGAQAAQQLGYTNVQHYAGGIAGWKAKEPVEKAS